VAKKPKDESAKSSSKSERQAKGSKPKSSRKDAKPKAKRGDKREDKARVERPEPAAATSGEALQEWVEDHTPAAPRPVAAVGALTEGMTEPGAPRELGLGERYLVDRAVARALRPALLVLLVVALAALWWGNRLREDRDASRSFAAQTELDAADVRSGRNEVAGLVDSVEASRREVERLKLELQELTQRASEERERAAEERRAAERALALAREYALEAEAHARSAEGQTVAQQLLVDRQGENAEQLAALSDQAVSTSDALSALLDTARAERAVLADELASELVAAGRLTEAVAGQLSSFWESSAQPWTERIGELEAALASTPVELRQTSVRLRWTAAAADREATLALAVRPTGTAEFLPLGEATFGAPSTYLIELVPAEAGTLLGAPWWTTEPTASDRTPDFERLSWTPIERDGAHLARLEATLASPDFSGELEFQWFALVDRRTQPSGSTTE
jgi:predicted  nucleic acid-binding Zn-ribbon protein